MIEATSGDEKKEEEAEMGFCSRDLSGSLRETTHAESKGPEIRCTAD